MADSQQSPVTFSSWHACRPAFHGLSLVLQLNDASHCFRPERSVRQNYSPINVVKRKSRPRATVQGGIGQSRPAACAGQEGSWCERKGIVLFALALAFHPTL